MKINYNNNLKSISRKNRKTGNLSEVILWQQIKGKAIKGVQFTRQKPILNYIVDFYCSKLKLVIEIDGSTHTDLDKDKLRQNELEALGLMVIRFTDSDVRNNLDGVITVLNNFIEDLRNIEIDITTP